MTQMDVQATAADKTVYLANYRPYSHMVERVELQFNLDPLATVVRTKLHLAPNPAAEPGQDLWLDGEGLKLRALRLNGVELSVTPSTTGLNIAAQDLPNGPFTLETEVEIAPAKNTALEGLYMSRGMYCTQCEAEGFRKITYYPDRPDVMAPFEVRIEAAQPVLLSNGNPGVMGAGFAEWSDPWPKPAYLFALVAGDLVAHRDTFVTKSGRKVDLGIWVREGDEDRCDYAMDSLKRSMTWDEQVYGREYDLDIFNIVAVDDFNMGAMENKGLNIFNSKFVLADDQSATDDDFARIEAIIAHEYFHNWTGNRITCRDWFQLCLKEGLTVYRDQQFSGDMRSHAVKRIQDVVMLRARQFREDQGPLAHAVRPESFVEINNFYTATIYEKGAELIGMLKTLVGDAAYYKALDLYFQRHDGQAATIEDWIKVFKDTTGRDLTQFKLWYSEAGTPKLHVDQSWHDGRLTLRLRQELPPTPGQPHKQAKLIPITIGLLNADGAEVLPSQTLEMTQMEQEFHFDGLSEQPVLSILRGFSAPVVLVQQPSAPDRAVIFAHDKDAFNRWEAGRAWAKDMLLGMILDGDPLDQAWAHSVRQLIQDDSFDPAFRALVLVLPSEDDLAQTLVDKGYIPDPDQIYMARQAVMVELAQVLEPILPEVMAKMATPGAFKSDAVDAGRRALRGAALGLLSRLDGGAAAQQAFDTASNMTETIHALSALLAIGKGHDALAAFAHKWRDDRNVMDKWFSMQAMFAAPQDLAAVVEELVQNPDFDMKNPNRFRAVFGALSANHGGFHRADGSGYRLLADWLLKLDALNPQTAARMSTAFETWPRYDAGRRAHAQAQLHRILAQEGLSRDLHEMATRMQEAGK